MPLLDDLEADLRAGRLDHATVQGADWVPDGEVWVTRDPLIVLVGLRPRTPVEQAHLDAIRIVHTGLADVLAWLGEPAWSEPPAGADVLARVRELHNPGVRSLVRHLLIDGR